MSQARSSALTILLAAAVQTLWTEVAVDCGRAKDLGRCLQSKE